MLRPTGWPQSSDRMVVDVSVVMPALDRSAVIGRALASIRAQDVQPMEVIVVDDGSGDDTGAIAAAAGARVVRKGQRAGSGPARNDGIALASTGWIAFLDSDDEWFPGHLRTLWDHRDGYVLVGSPALTSGGRLLGNTAPTNVRVDPAGALVPGEMIVTSSTMVRRDAVDAAGGFRSLARAQDLDLWLRVLEQGPGISLGGTPTIRYHEHEGQATKDGPLVRSCFDTIMASYADRAWLTPRVYAASYARFRWDDLRAAQRERDVRGAARAAAWFARYPQSLPALAALLRQRRHARRSVPGV